MHVTIENLTHIQKNIKDKINQFQFQNYNPNIVVVSKTFKKDHIIHLVKSGHVHFGENKVQEALEKWPDLKKINEKIKLHMIGKLQTNKVKFAVKIFDYIHSVDNEKLVNKISLEETKLGKKIKVFLQVNLGEEIQKSGVSIVNLKKLYEYSLSKHLDVQGLMCLPPFDQDSDKFFNQLAKLNDELKLKEISMGMSHDYEIALKYRSTFIRIGSKIFGNRA